MWWLSCHIGASRKAVSINSKRLVVMLCLLTTVECFKNISCLSSIKCIKIRKQRDIMKESGIEVYALAINIDITFHKS